MWLVERLFSTKKQSIIDQLIEDETESKKFKGLTKYFQDFEVKDLLEMDDPFELVGYVEPVDRLSMQLFLQKYLIPLFENNNQMQKEPKIINSGLESKIFTSGALISQLFSKVDQKRMTIPRFSEWIVKNVPIGSKIVYIDMSGNELLSLDLKSVLTMIVSLQENSLLSENGLIVDLQNNRIHGVLQYQDEVDECIHSMANQKCIKFVDIRTNPFVSRDRKDFFQKLNMNSLVTEKLIWIHELHLQTDGWRSFVSKDRQLQEGLINSHSEYFAWRKKNL